MGGFLWFLAASSGPTLSWVPSGLSLPPGRCTPWFGLRRVPGPWPLEWKGAPQIAWCSLTLDNTGVKGITSGLGLKRVRLHPSQPEPLWTTRPPKASFKACLAQRDNSDMNTEGILSDPAYEAIRRSTPLQAGAVAQAEAAKSAEAVGGPPPAEATAPGEDRARDGKSLPSYSGTSSLYPELPKGPSSAQHITNQLPLRFCP